MLELNTKPSDITFCLHIWGQRKLRNTLVLLGVFNSAWYPQRMKAISRGVGEVTMFPHLFDIMNMLVKRVHVSAVQAACWWFPCFLCFVGDLGGLKLPWKGPPWDIASPERMLAAPARSRLRGEMFKRSMIRASKLSEFSAISVNFGFWACD